MLCRGPIPSRSRTFQTHCPRNWKLLVLRSRRRHPRPTLRSKRSQIRGAAPSTFLIIRLSGISPFWRNLWTCAKKSQKNPNPILAAVPASSRLSRQSLILLSGPPLSGKLRSRPRFKSNKTC